MSEVLYFREEISVIESTVIGTPHYSYSCGSNKADEEGPAL